ncbi:DUF1772 domain-containing protein [Oscillatoria sp. FACHB-1407]|uniref:DUF1772 domain-containing protein n=1 Tax=Oscillatoria sp. FACHB-1407 TaxID=2692847 RepID=UPI001688E213|nr:DUF1772 domain-containing protein [Oscillatoria sp. FACHB-1407]MBD2463507.1 DUF1772 domain-containing protein [Oscillatoria sp. FACHB-1407]
MDFPHTFLLFCTVLIFYNLGLIWFAQIVIYPLFGKVGSEEYITYHQFYSSHIPLPVIIPGFASFLLPLVLIFVHPEAIPLWLVVANSGCALVSLFVTVALAIPRHNRLERNGKQEDVIQELIRYNWPRTLAITGSAVLTLMMVTLAFSPV